MRLLDTSSLVKARGSPTVANFEKKEIPLLMDGRGGTLHGRHHTTLQPDVLIEESGPDLEKSMPQALDDSEARLLLAPDVPNTPSSCDDDIEDSSSTSPRGWDETYRFRKRFGGLPALDVLDIMRESSRILRRQSDLLISLTTFLIVPVSVVILTHVLVTRPVIKWLEFRLEAAVFEQSGASMLPSPYTKYMYMKLAEFIVTSVLCVPLAVTLAALSKAGVVYTVASTYAGVKVSFIDVMYRVAPKVWLPLVVTYASSCVIFVAVGVGALLFVGISNGLFAALDASNPAMLLSFTVLGLIFCGMFIYVKIVLNVANVICVLEDVYGFEALRRSFHVVQGRLSVAVWSYLLTSLCAGFLMLLFEFRVTDKNDYTDHNSSGAWEGPLLVLMHSFVYLFDDIMTTVFYFTCPAAGENFDRLRIPAAVKP